MESFGRISRLISSAVVLVVLLVVTASVFYLRAGITTHAAKPTTLVSHTIRLHPHYKLAGNIPASGGALFSCQSVSASIRCYAPRQMRKAYDIEALLDSGLNGAGRTIVIIDAYQSPTISHDLNAFDRVFGLRTPTLNIISPDGLTPFDPKNPVQVGWSGEITLDVEWAHAIAPDATIDLVLAKSNADVDILSATTYAVNNNLGDVISQSFGEAEACASPNLLTQEHQLFQQATAEGITLIASSGDMGAAQPTCDGSSVMLAASTPASDPLVTAVGGTYLNASPVWGTYHGEAAWRDGFGASGGGFSSIYAHPSYQKGMFTSSQRGLPDVAYDGDVNSGVLVVWSSSGVGQNLLFIFGGTSAGSPQWAGITAIADQYFGTRLGSLNPAIYHAGRHNYAACFHDITAGSNTFDGIGGYTTRQGWDPVTGWGTPIANALVPLLNWTK